jgi:hypothetical protein
MPGQVNVWEKKEYRNKHHNMKCGAMEKQLHPFLTSALHIGESSFMPLHRILRLVFKH